MTKDKQIAEAKKKIAEIQADLDDFDGDRRGIAGALCDAENRLAELEGRPIPWPDNDLW